jgi:ABC-type phosphate/phosphonate transport system substrate-binding protein
MFRRHGMDPDRAFHATRLTGDHLTSLRNVYQGSCDAAAVYANMLSLDAMEHGMRPDEFYTIASTDRIPYDAYAAPSSQSDELTEALNKLLLKLKPRSELAERVLGPDVDIIGFQKAEDADYDPVREIERYVVDAGR